MATPIGIRELTVVFAVGLLLEPAFGQRGGSTTSTPPSTGGGTNPGGTPGGGRGNTGAGTTGNSTNNQTNPNQTSTPSRPVFISGRVMMDDGSELPRDVAIERFCGGVARIEGHTDSKGYFSFELGARSTDALQDASVGGIDDFANQSSISTSGGFDRQFANCELRVRMPGYQSQTVDLTNRQRFDNPDIGTIMIHRIAATEGSTVSMTTLTAPKNAKKALRNGLDLEKKKRLTEAQASFQLAVEVYPKYSEAWFELGRIQAAQGQFEPARHSFEESIRNDSRYVRPYIQLSMLELAAQRWEQLADVTDKAVRLDPFSFPQAFFFNAVAHYNLHQAEAAEQSARRAQKLDTQHRIPQVWHLLGVILAGRHDYSGAAAQMRDYLRFAPQARDAATVRSQLETLEKQAADGEQPQP